MSEVHKCPVCDGVGKVSAGYYDRTGDVGFWSTSHTNPETCRSCDGKGIVNSFTVSLSGKQPPLCFSCSGSGIKTCDQCNGLGIQEE